MRRRLAPGLVAMLLLLLFLAPASLRGQSGAWSPHADWARRWRPLRPIVELGRPGLGRPAVTELLLLPARRIGAFWTAGNPAALPRDVEDSWTGFGFVHGGESGSYRRPLDAVETRADELHVLSWRPVSDWGSVAGELEAGRVRLVPKSAGAWLEPYQGTPFVLTDTSRVDIQRTVARAEGGLGLRLGEGWRAGLAGGYGAVENRTEASGFPQNSEWTAWGLTAGVARRLGGDGPWAGVYGRLRGVAEEMVMSAFQTPGLVRITRGLAEPTSTPVDRGSFFRRLERNGNAIGVTLDGTTGGVRWVVYGQHGSNEETQTNRERAIPEEAAFDRWEAETTLIGLALQRRYGRLLATVRAEGASASGVASIPDLEEPFYRAETDRLDLEGEFRLLPGARGWTGAVSVGLWGSLRERRDELAGLRSELTLWRPQASLQVGRQVSASLALSGAFGVLFHNPRGTIPPLSDQGERFRELVGPAIARDATRATVTYLRATAVWRAGSGVSAWLRGDLRSASPGDAPASITAAPGGDRKRWTLSVGARLGGGE